MSMHCSTILRIINNKICGGEVVEIRTHLHETLHLPLEILTPSLLETVELRTLKKGDLLIRQGECQEHVYFLVSGILRGFFLDAAGQEVTDCFAFRSGTPAMPGPDLNIPAPISIEALTDATALCVPAAEVLKAMENSMACLQCAYGLLMASAQTHWELKMARYRYDARQRYLWFLSAYPGLIQKVSNKYVASFLGMNPSTLSRQKAALRNEKREKQREKSGTDDPQLFSAVFDPTKG